MTGTVFESSVLVRPARTDAWAVGDVAGLTVDSLSSLLDGPDVPDILLIGCGPTFLPIPPGLVSAVRARGPVVEWMDTGAACRTFNVLMIEERHAAAALIAVD
ncbi:MAG: Mth938-like domain-containing protein [Rhodobacterales bacterium]|nr:Mth938-like domain-containing protein [Rhodobacterales bacterium]